MTLVLLMIIGQLFSRMSLNLGLYAISSQLDCGRGFLAEISRKCTAQIFLLHPIRCLMILIWTTAGGFKFNYLIKEMSANIFQWKVILFPFVKKF